MRDPAAQHETLAQIETIARRIGASGDPVEGMRPAIAALVEECGFAAAGIAVPGAEDGALKLIARHGRHSPGPADAPPADGGPMDLAARRRETVRCGPVPGMLAAGSDWTIAIPLTAGGRFAGVLEIDGEKRPAPAGAEVCALEMLAHQIATIIVLSDRAEASERMKDYLERLVAGAGDGIMTIDRGRRIVRWNQGMEMMLGYAGDAMRGGAYESLRAPESRTGDIIGRCLAGETLPSVEDVLCCRDGRRLHVSLTLSPIRGAGGTTEGISLIVRDVTERRNMEENFRAMHRQIREAEEKFLGMIERASDAIFILDATTGEVIGANARAEDLTVMNRAELIGMRVADLHDAEDHAAVSRHFESSARGAGGQAALEVQLVSETERPVNVAVISRVINYGGRNAVEWVCRDISDRRQAEMQRASLQQQLLRSEKVSALGQLIGGVAHELNNPLTGVIGYAELLGSQTSDERLRRGLERVHSEARRCHRIVQNLLAFARRQKAEKVVLSINEVLESALDLCSYQFRVNNITVRRELQPDLPRTMADLNQVQQVFLNVLINAHQAILESGRKGIIRVGTSVVAGAIRIAISDNGAGIAPEDCERIFDPFYTTRPAGQGAGLGLTICSEILREHDGRIRATMTGGQETCIVMDLPILTPAPSQHRAERAVL